MKTIAIDFDGVLHSYKGWDGETPTGMPVKGAIEACKLLAQSYELIVFTTRNVEQVKAWLDKYGFGMFSDVTNQKKLWEVLVDDRAVRFDGDWQSTFHKIMVFEPYWRES